MAVMTVRYVPPEIAEDMLGLNALPDRLLTVDDLVQLCSSSPSTGRYDQTPKKQVYAEFGIPDHWIVTPDAHKPDITAFRLDGKHYERVAYVSGEGTFTATRPFPISFTPAELVRAGQS